MYHSCLRWVFVFVLLPAVTAWSNSLVSHWKFNPTSATEDRINFFRKFYRRFWFANRI